VTDDLEMYLDLTKIFTDEQALHAIQIAIEISGTDATVNFEDETITFRGIEIPLQAVFNNETSVLAAPYTVKGDYEDPAGKFPSAFGNVAIVDCEYLYDELLDAADSIVAPLKDTLP